MVADFVEAQGAAPFIAAADAYFDWYCRARASLVAGAPGIENGTIEGSRLEDLLDIDSQLAAWCGARGMKEPELPEERMRLHLEILVDILDGQSGDDHV